MSSYLCLSVTFLDSTFHGRQTDGEPEWPPSPLRLFQALVASAAARWGDRQQVDYAGPALKWLEGRVPEIVAPRGHQGSPYRLSVPNNAMDKVARAWSKGNYFGQGDANPATHRAMKTVHPTWLAGEETIHYLWKLSAKLSGEEQTYIEVVSAAARHLVALGWGIDLVAGGGRMLTAEETNALTGERWIPLNAQAGHTLRVPSNGTLDALRTRYQSFLDRVSSKFNPAQPLTVFREVVYARDTDPRDRPLTAFQVLTPDAARLRMFNQLTPGRVSGMVRHAARLAAEAGNHDPDWVKTYVLGHGDGTSGQAKGTLGDERFAYLPLPSVEERARKHSGKNYVIGGIRRVLVVEPAGGSGQPTEWTRRVLSGQDLIEESTGEVVGLLSLIPKSDGRLRHFVGKSDVWATVSPVVLPGFDDNSNSKAEALLRKAIVQAGFPETLAARALLDWRSVGYWMGVDPARRFRVPPYLASFPRYHVRIQWRDTTGQPVNVQGPVCIGAGRYCGLGLFAVEPKDRS
jgi:CRISPR-associated protein Csb2